MQLFCRIDFYGKLQGWGQSVQGSLSCPHSPGYQSIFANNPYFKLSEYKDVSIINIIHNNSAVFIVALFRMISLGVGCKLSRAV